MGEVLPSFQKSIDTARITVILPIQAPFIYRKECKTKKDNDKEDEIKYTEEQLNEIGKGIFLETLTTEFSDISGLSIDNIIIYNMCHYDIRKPHCFQGKVFSPAKEKEETNKENIDILSKKVLVDDKKVQSRNERFAQIIQSLQRRFENKQNLKQLNKLQVHGCFETMKQMTNMKKFPSDIAPIINWGKPNAEKDFELIYCSSDYERFAITLSFLSKGDTNDHLKNLVR